MEEAYKMINDALKKLGLSPRMQDEVIMQIEDFVSDVNEQNVDHTISPKHNGPSIRAL